MIEFFGVRCPSCGMTTSWSYMVRGQPLNALRSNAGGAVLAISAMIATPWLLTASVRGKWLGGRLNDGWLLYLTATAVVVTLMDWSIRLLVGR